MKIKRVQVTVEPVNYSQEHTVLSVDMWTETRACHLNRVCPNNHLKSVFDLVFDEIKRELEKELGKT